MLGVVLRFLQNRGDVNIFDGVENLITVPVKFDQARVAQASQVMRHG
jgi:hypothetical protein